MHAYIHTHTRTNTQTCTHSNNGADTGTGETRAGGAPGAAPGGKQPHSRVPHVRLVSAPAGGRCALSRAAGGGRPSSVPMRRDAGSQGVGRAVGGGSKGGGGDAGAPGEDTRVCALSATSLASLNATDAGDVSSRHAPEGGFVRRDDGPGASCHREIADSTAGPVGGGGVLFGLAVAAGTRGRGGDADSSALTINTASAVSPTSPTASGFIYSDRDEAVCAGTRTQTLASAFIHSCIHLGMYACTPAH